ncbi:MAG TPA: 2-amino-4-hydroxy-6-hydroxymethyldihydropteridine diphosphokinase [Burkholderiales bacterium]|nr:2-amino-4-hydroxy-6-hydroxymethyldihydropteridine diphosphokinase [Burkholderiales bacterium]
MHGQGAIVSAFIGIGSNLGDPMAMVRGVFEELGGLAHTRVDACSSLYRTAPVGLREQPDFINAVAQIRTALAPRDLLDGLLAIEQLHGRARSTKDAPRTLDLDLLLYDDVVMDEPGISIPHPRMHERAFVLAPLSEIAPDANVPGRGKVSVLLARVGQDGVQRIAGD